MYVFFHVAAICHLPSLGVFECNMFMKEEKPLKALSNGRQHIIVSLPQEVDHMYLPYHR